MSGGYVGQILEVDLTARKVKKTPLDTKEAQRFIGGRGLGAKWLWDRTKPDGMPQKLLDVSRIMQIGWQPRIELKDGIRLTCASYLKH